MDQPTPLPQTQTGLPPLPKTGSSPILIITLLLTFPPAAFYKMWKEPRYHRWFAYFLFVTGLISITLPIAFMIFITPKLVSLYHDFGRNYDLTQNNNSSLISGITGIIQLVFAGWIFYKTRAKQALGKVALLGTLIFVSLGLVVAFVSYQNIVLSALLPIYNLL